MGIAAAKPGRNHSTVLLRYAYQRAENGIIATTTSKEERAKQYLSILDSDNDPNLALSEGQLKQTDKAGKQRGFEKYYVPEYLKRD
ncbi:hypothetical protein ACQY0O_001876 [Thecaphora frezii]